MKSIRFKILMMAFVITLIVATVISMYGTYRSKAMVEASNEAYIHSLTNELALEMDNFIQLQKGYLNGQVNALTYIGDYSAEKMATFTSGMADGNDYMLYSYFNTLTDSGHFTSSDGWIPPADYSWKVDIGSNWFLKWMPFLSIFHPMILVRETSSQCLENAYMTKTFKAF